MRRETVSQVCEVQEVAVSGCAGRVETDVLLKSSEELGQLGVK
jgi:hypothetical protein